MDICIHGQPRSQCPLTNLEGKPCKPQVVQNVSPPAIAAVNTSQTFAGTPPPVRKADEITDPAARNAMELAAALEEVAMMKDAVKNFENLLAGAREKLAAAEVTCREKLKALAGPEKVRKQMKPRKTKGMTILAKEPE